MRPPGCSPQAAIDDRADLVGTYARTLRGRCGCNFHTKTRCASPRCDRDRLEFHEDLGRAINALGERAWRRLLEPVAERVAAIQSDLLPCEWPRLAEEFREWCRGRRFPDSRQPGSALSAITVIAMDRWQPDAGRAGTLADQQ